MGASVDMIVAPRKLISRGDDLVNSMAPLALLETLNRVVALIEIGLGRMEVSFHFSCMKSHSLNNRP